jgi:hypothetical protein
MYPFLYSVKFSSIVKTQAFLINKSNIDLPGQPNCKNYSLGWGICIPPFQTLPTPTGGILEVSYLLATAIQSFKIITRFKQKAKAMERACQLLCLLAGRSIIYCFHFHWFTGCWVAEVKIILCLNKIIRGYSRNSHYHSERSEESSVFLFNQKKIL